MVRPIPTAYQGTEADRRTHDGVTLPILKQGEFYWTTDNKNLFSGDNAETGGVPINVSLASIYRQNNAFYLGPTVAAGIATGNHTLVVNTCLCVPVLLSRRDRLNAIYALGSATGTSCGLKIGVFSSLDQKPFKRLDDGGSANTITLTGAGMASVSISDLYLAPGVYWIVAAIGTSAGTSKLAKYSAAETISSSGFTSTGNKITHRVYTSGGTYSGGIPVQGQTLESVWGTETAATSGCPAFFLKFI